MGRGDTLTSPDAQREAARQRFPTAVRELKTALENAEISVRASHRDERPECEARVAMLQALLRDLAGGKIGRTRYYFRTRMFLRAASVSEHADAKLSPRFAREFAQEIQEYLRIEDELVVDKLVGQ